MEQRCSLGYQPGMEEENYALLFWFSELQSLWAQLGIAINPNIQGRAKDFNVHLVKHYLTWEKVSLTWLEEIVSWVHLLFFNSDREM